MQHFVGATRAAVSHRNWHAAVSLALTLPDICGRIESPSMDSQARFVAWYDRFLLKRYQRAVGPTGQIHTFLCASDCYALRRAFPHQGEFGIDDQRAQQALENFHFTAPRSGAVIHMNRSNNTLQLQVDVFCRDVCDAVEEWLASVAANSDIQARISKLARIW
jgi:hypothetical protein